jgi:YD repeat-containing protein
MNLRCNVGRRLLVVFSIVVFTCGVITVVLQPAGTSAQPNAAAAAIATFQAEDHLRVGQAISPTATPAPANVVQDLDANKSLQPTPTPQGELRSVVKPDADAAKDDESSSAGFPITATRGYSELMVSFYNASDLSGTPVRIDDWPKPIDYELWCVGEESSGFPGCKLVSEIAFGGSYSARWLGNLIAPSAGEYTFSFGKVDDGARFYLDDNLLIDRWSQNDPPATIVLTAGWHSVKVEYQQRLANSVQLQVKWSGPNFAEEVIPMAEAVPECDCTLHPNCCENEVGGPINTRIGSYDYEQQDISLSALGESLKFKRTYNSLKTGTPTLGYGWTHDYNVRLSSTPGGLSFESCGGQQFSFMANNAYGANSYQGASGAGGVISRTGTYGAYTYYLTAANNDRYTFNNAGLPVEIRDAQGHTTTLTYSGAQLIRVADATGQRYLNFAYDAQGRLIRISDPLSRTIGYGYDAAGDLTVMTDTLGHAWAYTYDGAHRLIEVRNPLDEVVERTEYDGNGRAVRQWQGNRLVVQLQYLDTVDAWGLPAQTTIITDAAGGVSTDYYSSRGALAQQTNALASTSKAYDGNYNPTGSTDPNGHATSFLYNDQGRPLAITDALGSATYLTYDAQNHLTQLTDAAGNRSYYTYTGNLLTAQSDALGHTTIYTYNPQNLLIAQQDAQGRVTQYEYDLWGQRTTVTTTEGVTHYAYDQVGRLITTTDTFSRVTVNVYDAADHLRRVTRNYLAGQPQNYQQAYNLVTAYEYDPAGRQVAITDTLGRVNRNVYGTNGQLIKTIVNADPARAQNELHQYNITTEYGYDAAGRQVLVTDTLGHVSRTDYDVQSRPVTVTTNYKDSVYDPAHPDEDFVHVTQYDPAGNAIAQIDPSTGSGLGRVTRTWYDEVNRVISTTSNYDPNRPQNDQGEYNLITTYGYDKTGNRILITDTLGRVTRNYYDPTGRLISTTANYLPGHEQNYLNQYNLNTFNGYDESGRQYLVTNTLGLANHTAYDTETGRPLTSTTNYADGVFDPAAPDEDVAQSTEYDAHGNPYIRRDAAGRATRTWYDELNRAISVTANYQPDRPQNDAGQYNLVTMYGYDEMGNRAWVTDTLGHVTWTQYDALNRAVTVTQNYLAGELTNHLGQYNLVTTYEYDALGRQVAIVDPLSRRTRVEFDQVGRTLAQIDPLEQRTEYAYDVLGNRTVMTDAANHVTRFEYDTLNRLITTTRYLNNNPIREVTHYDAAGNRVETIDARGQATTYGYDALGRTIAITDANLHVTTFTYDPLGRRSRMQDARGSGTDYVYDKLGRQIATSDPLGNTTGYGYDVSGNRVVMTDANQIVTRYEYDTLDRLSAVIENYTGGAQTADRDVRTTYAYDPLGNRTVMTNARGYATTYEYDALNRLSRLQDARGKITEYAYDVVGNRTVLTDANGEVTLYAYDALNRQTAIDYLADATTVRFAYDAIGNRTAMTDTIGTTQYVFDDLNRLTSVTDPFAQTVGYAYDPAGNRTNVIYPDGKVVTYTYDAAGLLTGVIDWDNQTTTYEYDAANRLVTVTLPSSVQTVYTYDNANRLIHLSHTRLSDSTLLADYEFTLDKMGNRVQVIEAMEYPGDSQAAALPSPPAVPTLAAEIVEAITGSRAPGLSAPVMTGTLMSLIPVRVPASVMPSSEIASSPSFDFATLRSGRAPRNDAVLAPLAGPGDIFADSFESGNFSAWSAAVTNTGKLSVTTVAKRWGNFGMQAVISNNTAMYVRDDTPATESRYRARFYFSPNSITMAANNAHELFSGRTVTGTNIVTVQLRYASSTYQLMAQAVNDSSGISSTAWYPISNTWHFIEIDWRASTSTTAKNGYLTLWIDGVQKESKAGIDNDTRRVDEARLGPLSGIDTGTRGTEYFDAFESRRDTYIGPVALADFTANPISGTAPLTVTFTSASQPTATLTAYLWKFGDGYTSTITNPVHSYLPGYYTVTLTAWNGVYSDTITKTRLITATVKTDFNASPVTGTAPLTVTFANTSQPASAITAYLWNLGNGYTSTITNPLHTYAPGYYTVTLTAWSGSLKDVITRTRLITASIKAGFTATPVAGNIPLTVTFTNTSQPIDGASTFNWNFGDGVTSTVVQPTHVYTREGTFGVTLMAKSGVMQDVLTRTNYITATDDTPVIGDFAIETDEGAAPATAHNTVRNEYLVVWRDAYGGISGQRVSSSGHLPGAAIVITNTPGVHLDEPRLAYDPVNDQYLVVWVLEGGAGALQGRLVSGSGTPGTVFTFSDPASAYNAAAAVAYNPIAQAFLVTWYGEVDAVGGVWGQVVVNGALSGPAFSIAEESATATTLAVNPVTGDWLAVWTAGDQMEVRRVMSDGTPLGDVVTIATRVGFNSFHEIAAEADAAGNYLVVWRAGYGGNSTMRGQRVTAQGTLDGSALNIVAANGNRHEEPALAYRAASQDFFVVWQDNAPGNYDVRGAYITAGGQVIASSVDVIADGSDQHSPAVAYGAEAQTYLLVWQDTREPAGIYARRWRLPAADFSAAPLSGRKPLTVTFSNLSLLTEDPVTHIWDFGDGTAGSAAISPTHVYSQRGTYSVSLTITTGTYTNTRQRADYIAVDPLHRTVINYTYDGLYHLTKADSTGALTTTFEYAYDPVGNRTAQTATITSTQVTNYVYDAVNRLTNRTESTGQTYTYAWSDRGEMLAEYFQGNPIRTFTYNSAGQLSEATVLTLTTRFRYNGDGQRLSLEVVGSGTTTYALDYLKPSRILMETTAQTTTLYLYGHSCLGEWNATDGWKYYLQSTLGQVRQAVDDAGNVIYSWAYNPDGTVLQGVQGPITHLECEAVYDWSTGLIYRMGRYFDPTTGVWLMGTGMVLAQAGAGKKRKRRTRMLLLLILLLCLGGILVGCGGNAGPSLDPAPCKEITSIGGALGDNAKFVGPTAGNSLSEYPPARTWTDNDKDTVRTAMAEAVGNKFGGSDGFGGGAATVWAKFGVSPNNPIRLVREDAYPDPTQPAAAAAFRPWLYVYNEFFDDGSPLQEANLIHELTHYWDQESNYGITKDMKGTDGKKGWVNWGVSATDYGTWKDIEDFPEAVRVYFYFGPPYDEGREWTDDKGVGYDKAVSYGATGPDQLKLDATTMEPSATGAVEVQDRYDFVQWKLTGKWK